jgi:hypothetical protein
VLQELADGHEIRVVLLVVTAEKRFHAGVI